MYKTLPNVKNTYQGIFASRVLPQAYKKYAKIFAYSYEEKNIVYLASWGAAPTNHLS